MKDIKQLDAPIRTVFCDIDDTLTSHGKLGPLAYKKLWELYDAGFSIIPITGRPAGWCEMIARMWPVHGVIGENGAFYFRYQNKKMKRVFSVDEQTRQSYRKKLSEIETEVLNKVQGTALASDQFTRLFDLAIDFCEDVPPLDEVSIENIVQIFKAHGAQAKVSSIHVNGWFGDYNKRSMCETYYKNEFGKSIEDNFESCAFIGDSPNDEPMFGFFENSVAVANIKKFLDQLKDKPKYITSDEGGEGFAQFAYHILSLSK